MQRHHLLPRQLLGQGAFVKLFDQIGHERIGFDDFRLNGLLLPSREEAAAQVRMPLHRGPHRDYNAMVAERVGQIESHWARIRLRAPEVALDNAVMRLDLLQRALRRRLLAVDRPKIRLNRRDRLDMDVDFTDLDAMADALWASTPEPAGNDAPSEGLAMPTPPASFKQGENCPALEAFIWSAERENMAAPALVA